VNPDKFQQAWKGDAARTHVTIDVDVLSNEVQRSHRDFQATIFWRDVREVGTSLLMIPIWFAMGIPMSLPWTWYLTVPALIWIAGFLLVDRNRHPQRTSAPGEPLLFYVKESLTQVEHQIWLLRNVFWWYLLPLSLSIMAFFLDVAWNTSSSGWAFALVSACLGLFLFVIYGGIYRLNQRAVRIQLEPRRQDLLKLLASLEGEGSSEDSGDIMELASSFTNRIRDCGLNSNWAENWNRIVPSWRAVAAIILPTLGGALCGLISGLHFQIRDMGPTLFQTVVGAVIPFEIAFGLVWWRFRKEQKHSALTDHESHVPISEVAVSDDLASMKPKLLPKAPAMVIILLTLFLSVMAVLAIVSFMTQLRGHGASRDAKRLTESDFADFSAFAERNIAQIAD
jgi:hypothetical protein